MTAIIGHWKTLTEAEKLSLGQLVPGVIEEDIKLNNPLEFAPGALVKGKVVKWNREKTVQESDVQDMDIGESMTWTSSTDYDQIETSLKINAIPRRLDTYIEEVDSDINNYKAQQLVEVKKLMVRRLGDKMIYDDITYGGSKQFDGWHALAALEYTATAADQKLDIDNGSVGLSLNKLRNLIQNMKHGVDAIFVPTCLKIRIDAAYDEAGYVSLATATGGNIRQFVSTMTDDAGHHIKTWEGIPIIGTDYLVPETLDTGRGSNIRLKNTTGSGNNYSLFAVKWGNVLMGNPGMSMAFGSDEMQSKFYRVDYFDKLENYDASGLRLVTYSSPLLGSSLCLGRIHDITDVALTA